MIASGHHILDAIDAKIEAGSHVAIIGPSGAGKSSLVGLLLGWHRSATGRVLVDDEPLDHNRLALLRRETAWVDPAIQIWNRTLLDNLTYGADIDAARPLSSVISEANLRNVLERLPDGLQTILGEGGGLLSGGEGQRVRLGRAMLRDGVRLVILDEPFRGLDRESRRELLLRARQLWRESTLLCITHDISETLKFDRVLLIEKGRIAEDGTPANLADQKGSRYRELLEVENAVRTGQWSGGHWRRWRTEQGRIFEEGGIEDAR